MPLLADDIIVTKSTKEEDITAPRGDGDIDDLEFWLSAADAPTQSKAKQEPPAATGGSEPQADKVPGEEGGEVKPKKKKEKVDFLGVNFEGRGFRENQLLHDVRLSHIASSSTGL